MIVSMMTALALAAAPVAGQAPVSADEQAVRAALQHYLDGHATGRSADFDKAFYPESRLLFVRDGKFSTIESKDYVARAPSKPADDEAKRKRWIEWVDVASSAAVAKIVLDYPTVRFTDYMTLLKVDGGWRIANKAFHADRRDPPK